MAGSQEDGRGKRGRLGRPLAGRDGQGKPVAVSTAYKQTTVRLRPATKAALDAIALLRGQDRSTIIEEALEAMIGRLGAADRELIKQLAARRAASRQ